MELSNSQLNMDNLDMVAEPAIDSTTQGRSSESGYSSQLGQKSRIAASFIVPAFKQLFQCALVASLAFGSYWFFSEHVLQSVEVVGVSMVPTLHNSGHYLMDRWTYLIRDPQPNDIVVLRDPMDSKYSVKRIVATAGDSIHIKGGHVFINGRELNEPYLRDGTQTYAFNTRSGEQWVVCGANQYFVMGDNRGNSEDSRTYGPISRDSIVGTVMVR
jgi:signal peptidase I